MDVNLRFHQTFYPFSCEVADADASNLPLLHQGLHSPPRIPIGHLNSVQFTSLGMNRELVTDILALDKGDGEMDEIQVEVIGTEVFQRLVQAFFDVFGLVMRVPKLRGDEDLRTGDARGPDPLADLGLVAVTCCRINMAIAVLQSEFDGFGDLVGTRLLR